LKESFMVKPSQTRPKDQSPHVLVYTLFAFSLLIYNQ
jgi:hypothetical protein